MKKKENNYAFIDSQNVNLAITSLGWKLDFQRFRVFLRERYGVVKAFLFIGYVEGITNCTYASKRQGLSVFSNLYLSIKMGQ